MEQRQNSRRPETNLRLHFNLKQTRDKDRLTQIMLVTTINGQRIRVYTKLRIEPKYWDKATCQCRSEKPINLREQTRLNQINKQIKQLELSVYQADKQLAEQGEYLSSISVKTVVANKFSAHRQKLSPIGYLYELIDNYQKNLNRRGKRGISSTQTTYYTALKRLEKFCCERKITIRSFEDFDKAFFTSFANYLYSCTYYKGKKQQLYTQNTVVNTLKVIKNLLHRAYDNDMTSNNYYQKVQTILASDSSEQVYLEEKEIKKLSGLKLVIPQEIHVRDMFIIGCYTALRISDIQNLSQATIRNGVISLYQTKTHEQVEIPILKEIAPLLQHYQEHGFPALNPCKANKIIKDLAKRCSFNDEITFKEQRGGRSIITSQPKWKMISFHTARRSCITNLYKRGYPVNYIMTLSGHRSIQAFQRYMRATSKELMTSFVSLLKKERAI